ncbi:hypothetical protein HCN44_010156 [Aphidius gifuensis]|uniref:Uncharacterized protein n=1 Tax=Aphidius gifuensis TaxID=684658 RepID=A0A834XWV2_APHGI|nr:hypothetical protein HCN44_010156 [Aphidius gifuensis]
MTYNNDVRKYFEIMDYYKSCSFSLSPFESRFYGYWIVNTTYTDKNDEQQTQLQEFFISPPPPPQKHLNNVDFTNKERLNSEYLFRKMSSFSILMSVENNSISLRPKKVYGEVKRCHILHYACSGPYSKLVIDEIYLSYYQENDDKFIDELNDDVYDELREMFGLKKREIHLNPSDKFIFTKNERNCQLKIFKVKYIDDDCDKWIIKTYYFREAEQPTDILSIAFDEFHIYNIAPYSQPLNKKLNIQQGTYFSFKYRLFTNNLTFECEFFAIDPKTKKIIADVYNISSTKKDNSFLNFVDSKDNNLSSDQYEYVNLKYFGNYYCQQGIMKNSHFVSDMLYFLFNTSTFENKIIGHSLIPPLQSFDCSIDHDFMYFDILAVEGSVFTKGECSKYCFLEFPNGTFKSTQRSLWSSLQSNVFGKKNLTIIDNGDWKVRCSTFDGIFIEILYSITTWGKNKR